MKRLTVFLVAMVGFFAIAGSADATVLRVVAVETKDATAYLADIEKLRGIMARLGGKATIRTWRARFAGQNAGTIVVAIEYADLAAFATEFSKAEADPEYRAIIKGLDAKRKILSDSLYEEIK
jgi:uncharacterized protein (DUF1330 family)